MFGLHLAIIGLKKKQFLVFFLSGPLRQVLLSGSRQCNLGLKIKVRNQKLVFLLLDQNLCSLNVKTGG